MKLPKIDDIILEEDENLIILNKPPLITSEKENEPGAYSLADIVKRYSSRAMLCHRLDKETSGIIIAAKNQEAYRSISMQFEHRKVEKIYHALIENRQELTNVESFEVSFPIEKKGNKAIINYAAKEALTDVKVLEVFKNYSWLEVSPKTGRFHQIRVHLAAVGSPLVGDALYGGKPLYLSQLKRNFKLGKEGQELPLMSRAALHAFSLRFEDPATGKERIITAPYPKDFKVTLKVLKDYN